MPNMRVLRPLPIIWAAIVILVSVTDILNVAADPERQCPDPGPSPHLEVEEEDRLTEGVYSPGDYIFYRCEEGFSPDRYPEVTCHEDGTWDPLPVCQETRCARPQINHGKVVETQQTWNRSEWVHFECDPGYIISPHRAVSLQCVGSEEGEENGWNRPLPICKPIRCPPIDSLDIEDGYVVSSGASTVGSYGVGDNVTVACYDGFLLSGPETRTCTEVGSWDGILQICDDGESLCGNPGKPIGGKKFGNQYNEGDVVRFECDPGRTMLGDEVRTCLESGRWTGLAVICLGKDEYMSKEQLAGSYGRLIHHLSRETASSQESKKLVENYAGKDVLLNHANMKTVNKGSRSLMSLMNSQGLDMFFLLDTSTSISKRERKFAANVVKRIVKQLGVSTNDRGTQVGLVAFNNSVWYRRVPQQLTSVQEVETALDEIVSQSSGGGTAPKKALRDVIDIMIPDAMALRTRHRRSANAPKAVILLSDGMSNMGGDPRVEANELKQGMPHAKPKTEIYCIGIGDVNVENLKSIATSETKEHLFIVKDYKEFEVAESIINNKIDHSRCGLAGDTRLNNGARGLFAEAGAWPWMAGLYHLNADNTGLSLQAQFTSGSNKFVCGASLLKGEQSSSSWVLTAAHCVYNKGPKFSRFMLKFGSVSSETWDKPVETSVKIRAKNIIVHDDYNYTTLANDIALVELENPVIFRADIRPVCLPRPNTARLYEVNTPGVVTGWGRWNMSGDHQSPELKQLGVKLFDKVECKQRMTGHVERFDSGVSFCAGGLRDHNGELMDACRQDSGGPLMSSVRDARHGTETWIQTGIVSFGEGETCRVEGGAGGYVKVSHYLDWIQQKTGRE